MTSAGGKRPVVLLRGVGDVLTDQVARAGFAVVTFDPPGAEELRTVLDGLARGSLGPPATAFALVERAADGAFAITRLSGGAPGASSPEGTAHDSRELIQWLTKHLA